MGTPEATLERMARLVRERQLSDAVEVGEAALRAVDPADDRWDRVRVEVVTCLRRMNRRLQSEERLQALLSRKVGGRAAPSAFVEASYLCRGRHDLGGAVQMARRAVEAALHVRSRAGLRGAQLALAEALGMTGDLRGADEALAAAMDVARTDHDRIGVLLADGKIAARSGDWDRAAQAGERIVSLAEPLDARPALHEAGVLMARAAMARGTSEEALEAVKRALPWARATGMPIAEAELLMLQGELGRRAGKLAAAARAYEQARACYGADGYARYAELNLAIVEAEAGRWARADELADPLEAPMVDHPIVSVLVALLRIPAAAARGEARRIDEALLLARQRVAQAWDRDQAVLATGAAEACDPAHAVQLHALALEVWARLGLRDEVEASGAALRRLRGEGAPVPLGPFLLDRPIGRGAMGEVWSGRHAVSGAAVAVKLLTGGVASHPAALEALRRETEALAGLDHPAILAVLGHGLVPSSAVAAEARLVEGAPWLATELATGGALTERCGRLPWPTCRSVLLGVLDALAHAHAHGLVHLDLKAGNVLLDGGTPRLADFGLARALGAGERPKRVGTPSHMAPEQHAGDVDAYGPWTDLYGVGCLAVELVSGAPPFPVRSLEALRDAHFVQEPPPLQPAVSVPRGLEAWIRRLLCKAPEDRFQLAADAAAALERLGLPEIPGVPLSASVDMPSELPTVVLPARASPRPAPEAWADDREPCPIPAPQVPLSWSRRLPEHRRATIVDAGLSLFAHRRPRPAGRQLERGLLWAQLRQVAADGRCRGVLLTGEPGIGRGHLAEWLAVRAHEVGAALPLVLEGRQDPAGVAAQVEALAVSRPVVVRVPSPESWALLLSRQVRALCVLRADHEGPWSRHRDVLHLELERLEPEDVAGLVRSLLPLAPRLLDQVCEAAAGNPGRAVALVRALVDGTRLVLRADGYVLRPGAELPDLPKPGAEAPSGRTTFLD